MKKTYQTPALECLSLQTTHMLAESLEKWGTGGGEALTREKQAGRQGGFGKGMWEDMK